MKRSFKFITDGVFNLESAVDRLEDVLTC